MPSRLTRARMAGVILPPVALLALAVAASGQDKAPRRPPEPFRVFVQTSDPADAELKARLEEAVPMVRERVERRKWFQVVDSAETAEITLRITHYRQGYPRNLIRSFEHCWSTQYYYVDAVVHAGDLRTPLSGLDYRCVDAGPSLWGAARQLAAELERFAKDNYGALSRVKVRANEKRERGETPG